MGLPLYVAKSSSSEPDVKTKIGDKIPGPRRSVRRRARVNDLAHDSERIRARQRQRTAFFANDVNGRSSDEDRVPPRDRQMAVERADLGPMAPSHRSYIGSIFDNIPGSSNELRDWGRADDDYTGAITHPITYSALFGRTDSPYGDPDPYEDDDDDDDGGPAVWRDSRNTDGNSRIFVTRERTSAHTIDPWDLFSHRTTRGEETPGAAPVDGLGDRERSLSPDTNGAWNTLLATLTPDPQPPSAGSSFASTAAEQNSAPAAAPAAPAAPRHTRSREPGAHHECGFCDRCLRRRANIAAALRSRGQPAPAVPRRAEVSPYLSHGRRPHRTRFPTNPEGPARAADRPRRALSNDYNVVRRRQPGYHSTVPPEDDNSQEDEDSPFDAWTRRHREVARRQ